MTTRNAFGLILQLSIVSESLSTFPEWISFWVAAGNSAFAVSCRYIVKDKNQSFENTTLTKKRDIIKKGRNIRHASLKIHNLGGGFSTTTPNDFFFLVHQQPKTSVRLFGTTPNECAFRTLICKIDVTHNDGFHFGHGVRGFRIDNKLFTFQSLHSQLHLAFRYFRELLQKVLNEAMMGIMLILFPLLQF